MTARQDKVREALMWIDNSLDDDVAEDVAAALAEVEEWEARLAAAEHREKVFGAAAVAAEAEADRLKAGGAGAIAVERLRQTTDEAWTPDHDDAHLPGDLARAGAAYALNDDSEWPWPDWWNPGDDDRRRLVKAGALIAAEIDRIDRAALAPADRNTT